MIAKTQRIKGRYSRGGLSANDKVKKSDLLERRNLAIFFVGREGARRKKILKGG